jgi:hypothetical protein
MVANTDASLVYFEEGPVLFSGLGIKGDPTPKKPSQSELSENQPIAEWGDNNDFPKKARAAKESNPDLASALDWKARALYAGGVKYTIKDRYTGEDADTSIPEVKAIKWEVDQFLFRNRFYAIKAVVDFYDLFNVFAELIIDESRQKITRISALEAANCRYERRKEDGTIPHLFVHPDWEEWTGSADDKFLTKIKLLDPLNTYPEEIKADRGSPMKYAYPIGYPTGKNYYQYPLWWAVKVSKWLDYGNMIPEAKEAIIKNLALIRYHIQMPDYWMSDRYNNWATMNDAEKKKAIENEFKIVNDVLTSPANAGKSIFTMFKTMREGGREYGGWKIDAVDDKMKDGAFLADSSEATIKVFSATSIDPSLHGLIPGKGGSNRAGSDKREALNIYMSLIQGHEDLALDPWQFASWYNGWTNEQYITKFYFEKPMLQTLNNIPPAKRATIPESDAN